MPGPLAAAVRTLRTHPVLSPTALLEAWRERSGGHRAEADHRLHLEAALAWLERAQDATATGGFAWGYSLTWNPHFRARGWHPAYPEVTGYIIPTMYLAAAHLGRHELAERATRAARWEAEVQLASGAVRGGVMGEEETPVVFNTGQALLGWLSAFEVSGDAAFGDAARRAAYYLLNALGADGHWRSDDGIFCRPGLRLYNARTAWALAEAGARLREPALTDAAARALAAIARMQHPNGWLPDCCLTDPEQPLLHTLVYAARGLVEGGRVLADDRLIDRGARVAQRLAEITLSRGWVAGRLRADWSPAVTWRCLTGEAQMANTWMRLHTITGEGRWLEPVAAVLQALKRTQNLTSRNAGLRGGVKGSAPIGGGYGPYRVLSWATKFFVDALIRHEQIRQAGRSDYTLA